MDAASVLWLCQHVATGQMKSFVKHLQRVLWCKSSSIIWWSQAILTECSNINTRCGICWQEVACSFASGAATFDWLPAMFGPVQQVLDTMVNSQLGNGSHHEALLILIVLYTSQGTAFSYSCPLSATPCPLPMR